VGNALPPSIRPFVTAFAVVLSAGFAGAADKPVSGSPRGPPAPWAASQRRHLHLVQR
jgi:hypothetical protein